jgi:RimJ/RimL family protein N-acetyltransferase
MLDSSRRQSNHQHRAMTKFRRPAAIPPAEALSVPFKVRRATPADARAIAEVTVRGWQAAYRGLMPDEFLDGLSVPGRETGWRAMLEGDTDGRLPSWLVERDGHAIGFVNSGPPRDDDVPLPAAEVYALYVVPEEWRNGGGRALLAAAATHWRAAAASTLVLWVLEDNARARGFYEAMGWAPDGGRQSIEIAGAPLTEIRYRLATGDPRGDRTA